MYKTRFNIGDIVMERKDNAYSTSDYLYRGNFDICKKNEGRIPFVGIITGVQKRIYRTEEGEEIATIINDDKIDESIIVADGYTVRIKPKAN